MATAKKKSVIKNSKGLTMRVSQSAIAKQAIRNIDRLYRKMALEPQDPSVDKSRLLAVSGVPAKLIEQVAALGDQNGSLAGISFDSDGARDALAYAAAFEPVAVAAEAFAQRVRDSIVVAKSTAGASALNVYAAMRGYVRSPEGASLKQSYGRLTEIMKERRNLAKQRGVQRRIDAAVAETKASMTAATTTSPTKETPSATGKPATTVVVNTPGGNA